MRADRYFAQRGPGPSLAARVDGRGALRADGKFRPVGIVQDDLDRVLALGDGRSRLLKPGNLIGRQILSQPVASPDAVDFAGEDLAGIQVERDLDGLTWLHVFEVLLEEGREHIAVGVHNQGCDPTDTITACDGNTLSGCCPASGTFQSNSYSIPCAPGYEVGFDCATLYAAFTCQTFTLDAQCGM